MGTGNLSLMLKLAVLLSVYVMMNVLIDQFLTAVCFRYERCNADKAYQKMIRDRGVRYYAFGNSEDNEQA